MWASGYHRKITSGIMQTSLLCLMISLQDLSKGFLWSPVSGRKKTILVILLQHSCIFIQMVYRPSLPSFSGLYHTTGPSELLLPSLTGHSSPHSQEDTFLVLYAVLCVIKSHPDYSNPNKVSKVHKIFKEWFYHCNRSRRWLKDKMDSV